MKYFSLSILAIGIFLLTLPTKVAASTCQPIYGGGETCTNNNLAIEKQVLNPKTNLFVHDLGLSDPKYHGNDMVTFQITLTNNGNSNINSIVVKDTFPSQLTFKDGPGHYDPSNRSLTFTVNNLVAHHSQVFTVNATVISQDQFPADQSIFCIGNQVNATPSTGQLGQDSSQLCIEKITSTPSTGPEALGLLVVIPTLLVGIKLRKLSQ